MTSLHSFNSLVMVHKLLLMTSVHSFNSLVTVHKLLSTAFSHFICDLTSMHVYLLHIELTYIAWLQIELCL